MNDEKQEHKRVCFYTWRVLLILFLGEQVVFVSLFTVKSLREAIIAQHQNLKLEF